jgi:hypothetical protein
MEKQLKLKYHNLQKTLRVQEEKEQAHNITLPNRNSHGSTSSFASKLSIHRDQDKVLENMEKERKSGMFTRSILRTKSMETHREGRDLEEEEAELSKAVINYHDLCNDIYICDWDH